MLLGELGFGRSTTSNYLKEYLFQSYPRKAARCKPDVCTLAVDSLFKTVSTRNKLRHVSFACCEFALLNIKYESIKIGFTPT